MARVLAIPDLHCPFMHQDAPAFLSAVTRLVSPDRVILLGDEADHHAISAAHKASPDGFGPGHELEAAIRQLQSIYTLFPDADICVSNHGLRPWRLAHHAGLPSAYIRDYRDFMKAPKGWKWHEDITVDGVLYRHGDGLSGASGAINGARDAMQSLVIGHLHSFGGIQYYNNGKTQVFGFNVGCLIDPAAYAFAYGKHSRAKPTLGCGVIDKGVPFFFPMELDKHNRWIDRK